MAKKFSGSEAGNVVELPAAKATEAAQKDKAARKPAKAKGFDIEAATLPESIIDAAYHSGGYPYGKRMKHKRYSRELQPLQIELQKLMRWVQKEGERIVSRPQVRGSVLITASLIPPTNDTCSAGGRGYINALDAFSGTSLPQGYFDADGDGCSLVLPIQREKTNVPDEAVSIDDPREFMLLDEVDFGCGVASRVYGGGIERAAISSKTCATSALKANGSG